MDILISPLINMLLLLYGILGQSFVLAIIVATILVRLVTLPLTLPQQRSSRKMAELAPQLEELKKKYGNDRNKMSQAQMQLYKENNINMFGGCLPLILQLVIMIAFYNALTGSLATNPLQLLLLAHRALPALVPLIPVNAQFWVYDLGLPGVQPTAGMSPLVAQMLSFLLPALVVATTYLSQKLMTPPSVDPSQASMTKQMNLIMPLMFGLFALQFASGLSIYFIVSNLVGAAQAWFMNRYWARNKLTAGGRSPAPAKTSKPAKALPEKSSGDGKKSLPAKAGTGDDKKSLPASTSASDGKKSAPAKMPARDDKKSLPANPSAGDGQKSLPASASVSDDNKKK